MRVFLGEDFSPVYEQFGNAALIWRQLCHPNILPFLGLCHWTAQSFSLVSPWMENGNILGYVNKEFLSTDARISLFLDVALGIEYLHQNGVAHGYLKPSKILITASRRACIIDFGFSSIHNAGIGSADCSPPAGAVRYQAPELFTSENPSPSLFGSDVYAFGCVCYEVLTGNVPFFEVRNDMAVIIAVAGGRRPSRTQSCTGTVALDNLWNLIQDCWKHNPDERPTAGQIVERLVAPPIQATTQSTMDWDEKSTARFRRSLQAQTLQPPAITEIERQLL
ncbi:kinase-like domain-containing protein [Mycena galopus ATCC 62051]|nr:kinase-like domain-containing protein [Mycena galopus ATCC 62051]